MTGGQRGLLRTQVLALLADAGSYATPERTLFATLNSVLDFAVSEREMEEALEWLRAKAYVDFSVDELSGQKRWKITVEGKGKVGR